MITIEEIKNECLAIIAQAEKATPGPWVAPSQISSHLEAKESKNIGNCVCDVPSSDGALSQYIYDRQFIATSRSFTPRAAKAMLDTITGYQSDMCAYEAGCVAYNKASERLETIRRTWEESK